MIINVTKSAGPFFFSQIAGRVEHESVCDRYYASFVTDCQARSHFQYWFTAQLEKSSVRVIRLLTSLLSKGSYQ